MRACSTKVKTSSCLVGKHVKRKAESLDPRLKQFESLLGTIQQINKSKDCSSSSVSSVYSDKSIEKLPSDKHLCTCGRLENSNERTQQFCDAQTAAAIPTDFTHRNAVKPVKTVDVRKETFAKRKTPDVNISASVGTSTVAVTRIKKPHIEHREKGTTHFSHTNVTNFREQLSNNELLILSELAHAVSLPDEVRISLQQFINRQKCIDASTSSKTKRSAKSLSSGSKFEWNIDDVPDPLKLKQLILQVAKVLQVNKKRTVELAADREWMLKEDSYHASMASFVELCVRTGMLKLAHSTLTACYFKGRHKARNRQRGIRPVYDIEIYNRLMHAWAKEGNTEGIRKLFLLIKDIGLKPTFRSYAIWLQCLGRQGVISEEAVQVVLRDMAIANYKLKSIFNECQFVEEDQNDILKAIRVVVPQFVPDPKPDVSDYTCSLLTSLNGPSHAIPNPLVSVFDEKSINDRIWRQLKVETADYVVVESVMPQPELTPVVLAARERMDAEKTKWREALKRSFLISRQHLRAQVNDHRKALILPYLKLWKADIYVDMMMQEIDILGQEMAIYSPEVYVLHNLLGYRIFHKFVVQVKGQNYIEKVTGLYKDYAAHLSSEELPANHRELWTKIMTEKKLDNFMQSENDQWTSSVTKAIGKFLYDIILSEVKVSISTWRKISKMNSVSVEKSASEGEIPAFYTVIRVRDFNRTEEIMPHPFLTRLYGEAQQTKLMFDPKDMPSLVPPLPWFNHNCGGNILNTTNFIRNPRETVQQGKIISSQQPQNLYPMFDGLNSISACPWAINKRILQLVMQTFVSGGDVKLDIPLKVDQPAELPHFTPKMTLEERAKVMQEKNLIMKERKERYSQWCTVLYRISIANKYRDEVFWFPHNMDFRGRIYPTPAVFNHFGDDVARSILIFGRGKPLGPNGLNWLKIHLVNLTGFKKRCSNEERLNFANALMPEILDSAERPFEGNKWWQTADKPWQTLAACMELAAAAQSPDPEQFVSHIPVHQDGSCNVLQHYAALGRDNAGAKSVNLEPCDRPKDVYSDVLELVEKKRREDAGKGIAIAKSLEKYLQRKVIKQTVMTSVYGVTKYGARSQIDGQLRNHVDDFPPELIFSGRAYLAEKTFESLHVMFTTNKAIQDWLVTCAEIISRIRQQPVQWVTPLGWPVVQPYFKTVTVKDKKLGTLSYEKSNTTKQKNALPPNFIHSLDAAHLMLTAIHCLRAGVMFASVHDCFWTHACDIPVMNEICREQFVSLHNEPILELVAKSFLEKFGFNDINDSLNTQTEDQKRAKEFVNTLLVKTPKQGTFDITKVLESTYFFS